MAAASLRFNVPELWIAHVMALESAGLTTLNGHLITSSAGAMGLMQIMPDIYAGLRARYGLGADAYDPHDNIFAGAAYLRELYGRYGYPNLFAAYNAGPSRVDDFVTRGRPLPRTTNAYVATLTGSNLPNNSSPIASQDAAPTVPQDALFFVNRAREIESSSSTSPSPLFVTVSAAQR